MAMGILPGAPVSLIQNFPSYVFQANQTQFATNREIVDAIYIRLVEGEPGRETEEETHGHRWGGGRRFSLWRAKGR